ncbi:VaFE repeat-containing surface-anchored protein [uncultured Adlercreutzia sp.]|uniref:VaFE repeat-containing surface-anchored protein n=1 Tax=uncultured Adlercreutzia sp. TaxID=875803 RepID=UPI0026766E17|nr:VaFE repeat-containing surface-anchored protein [uncultured Adlercreutzia sp.]
MDPTRRNLARPEPGRMRKIASALIAFLLMASVIPFTAGTSPAQANEAPTVPVMLHFKDADGETVDYFGYDAPYVRDGDDMLVTVNDDAGALNYEDNLSFEVYENYAAFNYEQRDITEKCAYDPEAGTVRIPAAYEEERDTLGIIFWLSPAHPAYERYVLADLDTSDVTLAHGGQQITFASDVPDIVDESTGAAAAAERGGAFPGQAEKRYQLNPHTRLENFTDQQVEKQKAYGFPPEKVGSYGFGVLFSASQVWEDSSPNPTHFNDWFLDVNDSSFDAAVDLYFWDTVAARNGADAQFATAQDGGHYYDRYVTTGRDFFDAGISSGTAPDNRAMAHGTCGSSNVNNGYGAVTTNPNGDSYIVFKGTYTGSQSQYEGWYKFFYKFDAMSAATGAEFQDVVGYILAAPANTGKAQLTKASAEPDISSANGNYTLANSVFAAFADRGAAESAAKKAQGAPWKSWQDARSWADQNAAFTFVTQADGASNVVEDIEAGTYYVAELFAPAGFRLSSAVEPLEVEAAADDAAASAITFEDVPMQGSIDLLKQSNNPNLTTGNSGYSLAGATYGIYRDAACTQLVRELRCGLNDEGDGYARADKLPIGSYWVRETKRPLQGFALDERVYPVTVTDDTVSRVNTRSVTDAAKLNPLAIFLQKRDAQSKENFAQGAATLGDAHFRIDYYDVADGTASSIAPLQPRASWTVRTNDEGAFVLKDAEGSFTHMDRHGNETQLPYKVSGSDFYKLSDGTIAMPIGTYAIQEVKAPEGYLLDPAVHVRHITDADHDGEIIETFDAEEDGDIIADAVVRSDVRFMKRAEGASKLAGIPFKLTSKTTGEWHIVVTDKNGVASTESTAAHPHDRNTNANDEQFRAPDGSFRMPLVLDAAALDATAGTWFGLRGDGEAVAPDNGRGALPFDTYELEELRCPANEPFQMIRDEIVVDASDEAATIDMGTLNNTSAGRPSISTSAYDGISNDIYDREISADAEVSIVDRVTYAGLEPGEPYDLEAVLMDKATGKPFLVDDEEVTAIVSFTPSAPDGYQNVTLAFDASDIGERAELVVFETLLKNGVEEAAHRDIDDLKQTVAVNPITIGTAARDSVSGTHEGEPAEEVVIVDEVSYQGLTPGFEYRLVALLMDKATGEPFAVDGEIVTVEKTFVPDATEGAVEVEIAIPGAALDGVSLVVFESLYHGDTEVALHADLEDEGQTVSYGYPDLPLPPTGGPAEPQPEEPSVLEEPPASPLVQTGDASLVPAYLAALGAIVGGVLLWYVLRRRRP